MVLFEPFYPFLLGAITLAGGVPRVVRLSPPSFSIVAADVEAVINSKTRILVHNSVSFILFTRPHCHPQCAVMLQFPNGLYTHTCMYRYDIWDALSRMFMKSCIDWGVYDITSHSDLQPQNEQPHNPTGHVSTEEEMASLAAVCIKHNLVAISDEVYENAVFPPRQHHRLADVPGMRERTVTLSSAGKLFSLTGWYVYICYTHTCKRTSISI